VTLLLTSTIETTDRASLIQKQSENTLQQGWPICGPRGKYLRPSVTWMVLLIQF